jgi:WxL domain surface cell wall-binding
MAHEDSPNMRRAPRLAAAIVAAVALLLASASAALAATANDTTQFAVNSGSLLFGTAPDVPNLPPLNLNGQSQTLNAQMNNFAVTDSTGSGSGWNVTVNGDSTGANSAVFKQYCPNATCGSDTGPGYVSSGATLAANSLTLNSTGAGFTAQNGTTGTPPTHSCNSGCFVDSASAVKVISAAANAGMGTYQANSYSATSLALSAPSTVKALQANELYRVNLVWTLNSGP